MAESGEITRLLEAGSSGDAQALEKLLPLVYGELRALASTLFRNERGEHTLQPTALVHEAYLRLIKQENLSWENRAHFFGIAANLMRQILVNYANARNAAKRGGESQTIRLDEALSVFESQNLDVLELNEVLEQLAQVDARQARIVELKVFGGLSVEEIAQILNFSPITIRREWTTAKLWLKKRLRNLNDDNTGKN